MLLSQVFILDMCCGTDFVITPKTLNNPATNQQISVKLVTEQGDQDNLAWLLYGELSL